MSQEVNPVTATQVPLKIIPIILSGGAGSRLWPLSTSGQPKQFHALLGSSTMFGQALQRVSRQDAIQFAPPVIVCSLHHLDAVQAELAREEIVGARVILEPLPRNTAPALIAAALLQAETDPESILLVLPADHIIDAPQNLYQACLNAHAAAESGKIITFGISPTGPETGYGYIKSGQAIGPGVFAVEAFCEKPDKALAEAYLTEGGYVWNAGIFLFKARALIEQFEKHAPDVLQAVQETLAVSQRDDACIRLDAPLFSQVPAISVDYALMERTSQAAVSPVDMGWHDVGSFLTLWELAAKDHNGNVVQGPAALFDSLGCLVRTEGVSVSLIGVEDLIVIATEHGILVAHKDRAQDVRLAADAFKPKI